MPPDPNVLLEAMARRLAIAHESLRTHRERTALFRDEIDSLRSAVKDLSGSYPPCGQCGREVGSAWVGCHVCAPRAKCVRP